MNRPPVVLMMTATITPPANCPDLIRSDPAVRMNDYREALRFYLAAPSDVIGKIIFVENSDTDIAPLKAICSGKTDKTVEFISFPHGNDFPLEYGKGYGEMTLMDYGMDNSKILETDDVIWKATGRLICNNITRIIQKAPKKYDIYCDLHKAIKHVSRKDFFDPRFYSFTAEGYNRYIRQEPEVLKTVQIEKLYYDIFTANLGTGGILPRFNMQPMISGINGADGGDYFTLKKRVKRHVQQVMRVVAPWVWL